MIPDPELDGWLAERDRQFEAEAGAAVRRFADAYRELRDVYGSYGYYHEAYDLLIAFSQSEGIKPPPKKKGSHNPDRDKAMLTAYGTAPDGKKEACAIAAGMAHGGQSEDAVKHHLYRLLRERKQLTALLANYSSAHPSDDDWPAKLDDLWPAGDK
jgi:hypothetical protein